MTAVPDPILSAARAATNSRFGSASARQGLLLAGLIVAEIVVFGLLGTGFFSLANAVEILRLNVELGLLALALTLVIVSGGIDLSVGSLLGLCAICYGMLASRYGVPPPLAIAVTLGLGAVCGLLNGTLVARLGIPPLIVTLGSFSLFRGIAEGATGGAENFTNFASGYLLPGQGMLGPIPVQVVVFAAVAAVFYLLLHRSTLGRALSAIGFAPAGARHAGIDVGGRLTVVYVLAGVCAAMAAVIYVARVGQAKADAGTGYELSAITAVVLGGTSIFGGRGSIPRTLAGLLAIALLDNGLRLSDLSPELAGILKGLLLLTAIGINWRPRGRAAEAPSIGSSSANASSANASSEEFEMKNGQLAVLCAVIVFAALIVAGGNYLLLRGVRDQAIAPPAGTAAAPRTVEPPARQVTVAMMPKSKGNAYFIACRKGAEEAAKELNVTLLWDGPTDSEPAKQNEIVDTWVTRGVDVIAVSVDNRDGLSSSLRRAKEKGIKVVTFDADAQADARDFFINQATPQGIGNTIMDNAAAALGNKGEFAIITASLTAANQNEWMKHIEARRAEKYPDIKMVSVRPCDDLQNKAFEEARTILNANPNVRLIMAISSAAVPAAGEAVKQSGRTDVKVVGLGLPNDNKPYVRAGITTAVVLWNTMDLGYLTVRAARAAVEGGLKPGDKTFDGGRLGTMKIEGDNVLLGTPYTFDKTNIEGFDF
ncbi:MAG TPA: substrate-binding domain-containing protein [Tepidisphaeraceae bacterium]|jgi:rhamnose transport system permease protein